MNRQNVFDALEFQDNQIVNDKIDAVPAVDTLATIRDRQRLVAVERQTAGRKLEGEAGVVCRLEHPRTELFVNIDRGSDDLVGECIYAREHAGATCKKWFRSGCSRKRTRAAKIDLCVLRELCVSSYLIIV